MPHKYLLKITGFMLRLWKPIFQHQVIHLFPLLETILSTEYEAIKNLSPSRQYTEATPCIAKLLLENFHSYYHIDYMNVNENLCLLDKHHFMKFPMPILIQTVRTVATC